MKYKVFQECSLSALGFGAMRLPLKADGSVDRARVMEMVDYALSRGINYFDTAFPYHGGYSEIVLGEALSRHPRESFYLATKYPGHQLLDSLDAYQPEEIFRTQLEKSRVDYFDFYLLHNVIERSVPAYVREDWGIVERFVRLKEQGLIRHLGFSTHARPETLRRFLERFGSQMEFCQIQLNYLDWTLQEAREKCEILKEFGIPVWVMEPVRGGRLARLKPEEEALLRKARPEESPAAWALRFAEQTEGVGMVLSGMSNFGQLAENIRTFENDKPLSDEERALLLSLAETMKRSVPCTGCRYCCEGCPMGLDIPKLISLYNELSFGMEAAMTPSMQLDAFAPEELPTACLGCGACAAACPQSIDIPSVMEKFSALLPKLPSWDRVCREREEAARKLKG